MAALVLALVPAGALGQVVVEDPSDACPDADNPAAPFPDRDDIPRVHVLNVDCAFNNEITVGFTDGTFRPRDTVTRDQFASFLVATLRVAERRTLPQPSDQGFTDIGGSVHEDAINVLAEAGITEGRTASEYAPRQQLTRDQVATFLLRAVAWLERVPVDNLTRGAGPFVDVPAANVHRERINGARVLNLTVGRTATTFEPREGTQRAQMASFLIRLLAALSEDEPIIPPELRVSALQVEPAEATNPISTDHEVTATATDDGGERVAGATVRFEIYRHDAGQPAGTFAEVGASTAQTDADGEVVLDYTGPAFTADDRVVACVLDPEYEDCGVATPVEDTPQVDARVWAVASKAWHDETDEVSVDDEDLDAVNPVGTDHTVTATAVDADGDPVAGVDLRFEVYRSTTADGTFTGPVETAQTVTEADGRAQLTYTGPDEDAVDRIVICRPVDDDCLVEDEDPDSDGVEFSDDPQVAAEPFGLATKTWESDPFEDVTAIGLEPDRASNQVGTEHTVTATATDVDDAAVAGADVRLEVFRDGSGTPALVDRVTTGDDGEASFTYTGPSEVADDVLVVCPVGRDEAPGDDVATCEGAHDRPAATATKDWRFQADSAFARADGADGDGDLGDPLNELLDLLGGVSLSLPADEGDRAGQVEDEFLSLPGSPVLDLGVGEVAASGDLDEGTATATTRLVDLGVVGIGGLGNVLGADAIHVQANASCPAPGEDPESDEALRAASDATSSTGLQVFGDDVELDDVEPNTEYSLLGVADVTVRRVEYVEEAGQVGYVVAGLEVSLLSLLDDPLTFTLGEAEARVDCT